MDDQDHRQERDEVPRVVQRGERDERAETGLAGRGPEIGVEQLACAQEIEQERADGQVHERERRERCELVGQVQLPDIAAGEDERVAARDRGERERHGLERDLTRTSATQWLHEHGAQPCDQRTGPGPDDDDRGEMQARGDAERRRVGRLASPPSVGVLDQLADEDGSGEQRDGHGELGAHRVSIGTKRGRP